MICSWPSFLESIAVRPRDGPVEARQQITGLKGYRRIVQDVLTQHWWRKTWLRLGNVSKRNTSKWSVVPATQWCVNSRLPTCNIMWLHMFVPPCMRMMWRQQVVVHVFSCKYILLIQKRALKLECCPRVHFRRAQVSISFLSRANVIWVAGIVMWPSLLSNHSVRAPVLQWFHQLLGPRRCICLVTWANLGSTGSEKI